MTRLIMKAAALILLALGACATASSRADEEGERELFAETYDGITRFYIDVTSPERLTMAGLARLSTIDPALAIERDGDALALRLGRGVHLLRLPESEEGGPWAELTVAALTAARGLSPAVARLSEDALDTLVIEGATTTLDRFSRYAAPDIAGDRRASRDGYGGIGVTLDLGSGAVRITSVQQGGPADSAGLRPEDRILGIDGVSTAGIAREEVVRRLRGAAGSRVLLAIGRASREGALTIRITRTLITVPTVAMSESDGIATLKIDGFNQQTAASLSDTLDLVHREMGANLRGILLDLRGNPGGLLDQSIDVADHFLDGLPVVSTIGRHPQSQQNYTAPIHENAETVPMVVLVNGGSASAAEVVAAALQDTGRAVVLGSASYGKGTVQTVLPLPNGGELTVTWARLIPPAGYLLHEHGVVPTVCTSRMAASTGVEDAIRHNVELAQTLAEPR
ncbi:MAG TPA: S41 family peptidase, partial [Stellaceae bacterium]|nr:S41 family peptidase [Stellaceae bacterium]